MIPTNPVNPLSLLTPAEPGARARPGLPPSAERLRDLKHAIRSGAYRVSPDRVALAILSGR
jgi:anti-sigma28 factor (negative regulator of flagellin synthesis)